MFCVVGSGGIRVGVCILIGCWEFSFKRVNIVYFCDEVFVYIVFSVIEGFYFFD